MSLKADPSASATNGWFMPMATGSRVAEFLRARSPHRPSRLRDAHRQLLKALRVASHIEDARYVRVFMAQLQRKL